jgi:translocation and assembly module TamB
MSEPSSPPQPPAPTPTKTPPEHRHRGRKVFFGCGIAVLAFVVLLLFAVWFLLGTQAGTRFLFTRLGALLPGSFEVSEIHGPISGPLDIRGLTYKKQGSMEIHVAHLYLEWRLRELLSRRLDVQKLYADGIRIVQAPPTEEKTPLPDINLHFNILVRDARVRGLDVDSQTGQSVVKIDSIDLVTTELKNVFHLDRLAVRSQVVNADVSGRLQPQGDYPLDLTAKWSVRPPGMAEVAGGGTLSGTLKRLQVTQSVTAPFPVEINTLLLEPLNDLRFDGKVAFRNVNPKLLRADLPDLPASGEVSGRGSLNAFTSDGTVRGKYDPAGDFAVQYRLAREGKNGETWRIDQADVSFPGLPTRLHLAGRYTDTSVNAPVGKQASAPLDVQGNVTWHALAWPLRGAKPSFESPDGQAKIEAHGPIDTLESSGTVQGTLAPFGQLAAVYQVMRQGETWKIAKADLSLPGTPTRASVTGRVTVPKNGTLSFDANAAWRDVAWPLRGTPTVRSAAGKAVVSGTADRYNAQVDADVAGAPGGQIPPGHWVLAGNGTQKDFHFASLAGDVLQGHLTGSGTVGWSPRVRWDLALTGQGLNPATLKADFPGKLDFAAKTRGEMLPSGPTGTVDLSRLVGTLRQQPIAANAAVRLAGKDYDISHLDAHWGDAHLAASGRVGDRFDLKWDVNLPNLGLAVPQAAGSFAGHGHLGGPLKMPRVTADGRFAGLRSGTNSVAQGTIQADVDLAPSGTTQLDLTTGSIQASGQNIGALHLQLRGTLNSHTLTLSATGLGTYTDARLDLALTGSAHGELGPQLAWMGQIARLDLHGGPAGDWSLEKPATLAASASAARLDGFCWHAANSGTTGTAAKAGKAGTPPNVGTPGNARLCAGGSWAKAGNWTGQATLTALPLNLAKPFLPTDLTITGNLEGNAKASGSPKGLTEVVADLAPGPGELHYPGDDGRTIVVRFERGTFHARLEPNGGDANAKLTLVDVGTLGLTAKLPSLTQKAAIKDLPLAGRLDVNFKNLSFVEGFVSELRGVTGTLNAGFQLAGTLGTPRLTGSAQLANGRAKVPEYGLDVKDITLKATGDGSPLLQIQASARSGPGTLTIAGTSGLFPTAATPMKLKITGRKFQVSGTREIDVQISPALDLAFEGTQANVTGQVDVPYGRTNIENRSKPGAVPTSSDVVFVGGAPTGVKTKSPLAITARVRLVLGDDIELKALGLDAKPKGSILVVEQPGRPESAVGEIEVSEGTFKAYGQDLTIERGRLIFAGGPLDDPGIDLRAYRTATDGTIAGIQAQGTLKKPEVTLYSTPTMTESEALAYLLLGHPLGQASPQEGSLLANAATSLGLKGGNLLAKKLATRFGLESATFESSGGLDQTALVLGKYLSPRLYVSYGLGLFEPINTFRIRYILNKRYTLQAEDSGTGTGADILYVRER